MSYGVFAAGCVWLCEQNSNVWFLRFCFIVARKQLVANSEGRRTVHIVSDDAETSYQTVDNTAELVDVDTNDETLVHDCGPSANYASKVKEAKNDNCSHEITVRVTRRRRKPGVNNKNVSSRCSGGRNTFTSQHRIRKKVVTIQPTLPTEQEAVTADDKLVSVKISVQVQRKEN